MEEAAQRELEATVAAAEELGPGHDDHLISGFLERIEEEIDRRVEERVARRGPRVRFDPKELGIAVPIVAVAGIFGPAGVFFALAALVVLLFFTGTRRSEPRRRR